MRAPLGESASNIMPGPTPQRAVALSERALLHCLARHTLKRSYCIGLTNTRLLVLGCEPRCMWLSVLFLRPAAGLSLAVGRGHRGCGRRLVVMLGGAMSFQTVFELLLIDGWLVKRLPPTPVRQDQASDAAHVVFHHLRPPFIGRQGNGRPVHGDVGAHAINVKVHTDASNQAQHSILKLYGREPVSRRDEAGALPLFGV